MNQFLLQCVTLDGIGISHAEQVRRLCEVGAKWIQLRMKEADAEMVEKVAEEVAQLCRDHEALLIVNDHVEIAKAVGAGGVHLGREDMDWQEARKLGGPDFVIGGTVNSLADARRALASRSLDYVGVGPFRHTISKKKLAPVLSSKELEEIVQFLGDLPKVVIGGVRPEDCPAIASMAADGVAVSSGLFAENQIAENFNTYIEGWPTEGSS